MGSDSLGVARGAWSGSGAAGAFFAQDDGVGGDISVWMMGSIHQSRPAAHTHTHTTHTHARATQGLDISRHRTVVVVVVVVVVVGEDISRAGDGGGDVRTCGISDAPNAQWCTARARACVRATTTTTTTTTTLLHGVRRDDGW